MRAKKFVCCLLAMMLLAGVSFISCGNSSKAKADSELTHKTVKISNPFWINLLPVQPSSILVSSSH